MQHGGQQRPAEHDIRQTGGELEQGEGGDPTRLSLQPAAAMQPPCEPTHDREHQIGQHPMRVMDGRERLKADVLTARSQAKRAPQFEGLPKIHCWPPCALASRETAAGQHRIVGAHPAAERNLQQHQRQARHQRRAQTRGDRHAPRPDPRVFIGDCLPAQQRQQHHAAQQVHGHDRGPQPHGNGQRAERALEARPGQRHGRPPGANRRSLSLLTPGGDQQRNDENAHAGGEIAVDHLDPGFGVCDRTGGHLRLRCGDLLDRAHRAGVAVAAWPVGTT